MRKSHLHCFIMRICGDTEMMNNVKRMLCTFSPGRHFLHNVCNKTTISVYGQSGRYTLLRTAAVKFIKNRLNINKLLTIASPEKRPECY